MGIVKPPRLRLDPRWRSRAGLVDCWVFGSGGLPQNITKPSLVASAPNGQPPYRPTPWGVGGYGTGGKFFRLPVTDLAVGTLTDFSIRIVGMPVSWTGGFTAWIDSAGRICSLFADTSGKFSFGAAYGISGSGLSIPPGRLFDVVVTYQHVSPFAGILYLNGKRINSGTWGSSTGLVIDLGVNTSGGGSNPDCVYFLYQSWSRIISQTEILANALDIWGVLEQPQAIPAELLLKPPVMVDLAGDLPV